MRGVPVRIGRKHVDFMYSARRAGSKPACNASTHRSLPSSKAYNCGPRVSATAALVRTHTINGSVHRHIGGNRQKPRGRWPCGSAIQRQTQDYCQQELTPGAAHPPFTAML